MSNIEKLKRIREIRQSSESKTNSEDHGKDKTSKYSADVKASKKKRDDSDEEEKEKPRKRKKSKEENGDEPSTSFVDNRRSVDITKPTPKTAPVKKASHYAPLNQFFRQVLFSQVGVPLLNPYIFDCSLKLGASRVLATGYRFESGSCFLIYNKYEYIMKFKHCKRIRMCKNEVEKYSII